MRHGSVLIFGEGDNRVRNFEGEKKGIKKLGKIHIKKIVCGFYCVFPCILRTARLTCGSSRVIASRDDPSDRGVGGPTTPLTQMLAGQPMHNTSGSVIDMNGDRVWD